MVLKKSKKSIIILDKNSIIGKISDKNEIILTPSFYWVAKRKLPIKFAFEAKKYMPSIFEEIAPPGKYSYFAIKEDDEFLLFAYDDKKIIDALEKSGIPLNSVSGVYFAQNELRDVLPIDLENGFALDLIEGIATRVPANLVKNPKKIENLDIPLKYKINLKRYSHIVDESGIKKIAVPLMVLIIAFGGEAIYFHNIANKIEKKANLVFEKYNLPSTKLQNRAIYGNLKRVALTQNSIRDFFYKITSMPLRKDEEVKVVDLSEKKADVKIVLSNQNRVNFFKRYFLNSKLDVQKIIVDGNIAKVEFNI